MGPILRKVLVWNASYLVPLLVFISIWVPEAAHYYVPPAPIQAEILEAGRRIPSDAVLNELKDVTFGLDPIWADDGELVAAAERLLKGEINIPGLPNTRITMPFDAADIDEGSDAWQLYLASLVVPKTLLKAYEVTGREEFLTKAGEVIQAWASYERRAWLPKGFLWNDHAIAARIPVLAQFWNLYRGRPEYRSERAATLFQLAARSAELLAKPEHFTFSTNHGVMQNLGLMHIGLAFPTLPGAERYKRLAFERLRDQYSFHVSEEGVILEHSAGYHRFGVELMGMAMRYLTLMNVEVPPDWREKYERGKSFYAMLRRPDGSLPLLGDTWSVGAEVGPLVTTVDSEGRSGILEKKKLWRPGRAEAIYPFSGYSIWIDGWDRWPGPENVGQTVVAWSYFPGYGHKHADEMSLLLWAGGETWWTNVGYWPYQMRGRLEAESWPGSNAPHLAAEPYGSPRKTTLLFHGTSDEMAVVDLERKGPGKYSVRRQVIHLKPSLWAVVDSSTGGTDDRTATTWTSSHKAEALKGPIPGAYRLQIPGSPTVLTVFFSGSTGTEITQFRGSLAPFAGWEVVDGVPRSAPAIVLQQPADDSWAVASWSLRTNAAAGLELTGRPDMQNWNDAEGWEMVLPERSGPVRIRRSGNELIVKKEGAGFDKKLVLERGPRLDDEFAEVQALFSRAAAKYPRFRNLVAYRWKMTYFLIFIFLLQEVFFIAYRTMRGKYYVFLRALNLSGWAAVGVWLALVYFKT